MQTGSDSATYKSAGVDIRAGEETVDRIKNHAKSTFNSSVLSGIGHFGAFFKPDFSSFKEPVLVSSVDGVGTKLRVAINTGIHSTIGQCLVNHCVNDIAVCGATPLFFMDYMAFGKLNPRVAEEIVAGFAKACRENGVALIGGETAEMPGMYQKKDYDLSGTIVGIVDRSEIIDGSSIQEGDVLIGFRSNGLHTNGYSLARKVLLAEFRLEEYIPDFRCSMAEELLKLHISYLPLIKELKKLNSVKGLAHITGGGIEGNTKRVLPEGFALDINWDAWPHLPVFKMIQEVGDIPDNEMRSAFNLGIGLVCICSPENAHAVMKAGDAFRLHPKRIGTVIKDAATSDQVIAALPDFPAVKNDTRDEEESEKHSIIEVVKVPEEIQPWSEPPEDSDSSRNQ
ncbi:MAG: phosphoribosylformylglycinamidine cyclo-ligase [Ignavibacteriales bacterium]